MIADRPTSWPVTSRKVLARGRVSNFVEDVVQTPDGLEMGRQYATHPGAVAVLPWDEESDEIIVLRQYRHPVGMELVEIPAGLLDVEGEDWLSAAQRELAEEVELQASCWRVLVDIFSTPGGCQESLRIYLARGLQSTSRPRGFVLEGEEAQMSSQRLPRQELLAAVFAGRCQSPALVAGVLALETARLSGAISELRAADASWLARS